MNNDVHDQLSNQFEGCRGIGICILDPATRIAIIDPGEIESKASALLPQGLVSGKVALVASRDAIHVGYLHLSRLFRY
jgi:hypothetical protein